MGLELKITIPQRADTVIELNRSPMILGSLSSNPIILHGPNVDPIHAVLEENESGAWSITDLGSTSGVVVNGKKISVEHSVDVGDVIEIGLCKISIMMEEEVAAIPHAIIATEKLADDMIPPPPQVFAMQTVKPQDPPAIKVAKESTEGFSSSKNQSTVVRSESEIPSAPTSDRSSSNDNRRTEKKDLLFNPRKAKPQGDVLEMVAYWDATVLDVDLFHPKIPGNEKVLIGSKDETHFIAGAEEEVKSHKFAEVKEDGYRIHLLPGMEARIRKGGEVETVSSGSISLGRRDLAHVKYGGLRYFLLFVNPPNITLPKRGSKDPFFMMMSSLAAIFYIAFMVIIAITTPKGPDDPLEDDPWALVTLPELEKPPVKSEPTPPPKVEVAEVKTTPPPSVQPPPPAPKPVQPAKPEEKEKPKQPKPVETPVAEAQKKPVDAINPPKQPQPKPSDPGDLSKLKPGLEGMASTGAKKPDFKLAGPKTDKPLGPSGGKNGSGMNQQGGERKGNQKISVAGVEGPNNNKASGINLEKLGVGVGNILDKTGPSAIQTNFKSSAGGAGGGSGSGARTIGLGGIGNSRSLGVAGSEGAANNFGGGGSGYLGSGQNGSGGLGGAGLGKGFGGSGRSRASISVPAEEPVTSSGLTPQEVLAVIKANLNQIRHCYEQLLQRSPNAAGKLAVKFIVGVSGRVDSAVIEDGDISDTSMRGCVTGKIVRWKFPEPRGGQPVTVNYPFVFNPL